jgi:hypothetical protein
MGGSVGLVHDTRNNLITGKDKQVYEPNDGVQGDSGRLILQ